MELEHDGQTGEVSADSIGIAWQESCSNDDEVCRQQLALAERVLAKDPNYSEARIMRANEAACEDNVKVIDQKPNPSKYYSQASEVSSNMLIHDKHRTDVHEAVPTQVNDQNPSNTPSSNSDNTGTAGKRSNTFSSRIYSIRTEDEVCHPEDVAKRPKREPKPVHHYSQELSMQGIEQNVQSGKGIPGKKRQGIKNKFAHIHGLQACNKPCAVCFKLIKCMELMHVNCIFAKANGSSSINLKTWICPKCKYLAKLPLIDEQPKVVVEEIVWALLDGTWMPATAVAKAEYRNLPLALFVNKKIQNDSGRHKEPFEGEKLVQWFGLGRATYSWIKVEDVKDFIQFFDLYANQKCQQVKRRRIDLDKKIKLALNVIPDFRPDGCVWLHDHAMTSELKAKDVDNQELYESPCVVCGSLDDEAKCLICDNCNMCLHFFCIGLATIPDGAWICPWCAQGHALKSREGDEILMKFKNKDFHAHENHANQDSLLCRAQSKKRTSCLNQQAKKTDSEGQIECKGNSSDYAKCVSTKKEDSVHDLQKMKCTMMPFIPVSNQKQEIFAEYQLIDFYKKIENEYGFRQPGFHGEQDWLEGSLVGYGQIPLPNGPEVIAPNVNIVVRSGYGLLQGGTVRREVVRTSSRSPQLKILQYRLRKTSLTMPGPMSALQFLQTLSQHVREEAARNFIMSEALLCHVQGSEHDTEHYRADKRQPNGLSVAPWLRFPISEVLINQYLVDCSPTTAAAATEVVVPELNICPSLVDSLAHEYIEDAAEAAIVSGNLKFGGFKHIQGNVYETIWSTMPYL